MKAITIYSSDTCPYCHRAKALLRAKDAAFDEVDVTKNPALRAEMTRRAGGRTSVPQIFIGTTHVGGCDDLYDLDRRGHLDPMLQAS